MNDKFVNTGDGARQQSVGVTMEARLEKFRILNVIAFVVFSIALGHVTAALFTGFIFSLSTTQILGVAGDPANADLNVIVLLAVSYSLSSFFGLPLAYLFLTRRSGPIIMLLSENKIALRQLLLSIALLISSIPCIAILITLNNDISFPVWLTELENYFRRSEESARQMTSVLLSFHRSGKFFLSLFVIAIIPGIVEEIFFRGIIQTQLQGIFRNVNYAVWLAAFLFSVVHFQFYGFIPRLVLGALLGYIFLWTKNIWYSCVAHIVNNALGVVGIFLGTELFVKNDVKVVFAILSACVTVLIMVQLKRTEQAEGI